MGTFAGTPLEKREERIRERVRDSHLGVLLALTGNAPAQEQRQMVTERLN